jgi:hypothetical protein
MLLFLGATHTALYAAASEAPMDPAAAARFAGLALKCLHQ